MEEKSNVSPIPPFWSILIIQEIKPKFKPNQPETPVDFRQERIPSILDDFWVVEINHHRWFRTFLEEKSITFRLHYFIGTCINEPVSRRRTRSRVWRTRTNLGLKIFTRLHQNQLIVDWYLVVNISLTFWAKHFCLPVCSFQSNEYLLKLLTNRPSYPNDLTWNDRRH